MWRGQRSSKAGQRPSVTISKRSRRRDTLLARNDVSANCTEIVGGVSRRPASLHEYGLQSAGLLLARARYLCARRDRTGCASPRFDTRRGGVAVPSVWRFRGGGAAPSRTGRRGPEVPRGRLLRDRFIM